MCEHGDHDFPLDPEFFIDILWNRLIMRLIAQAWILRVLLFKLIDHDSHECIHKIAKFSENCVIMMLMNFVSFQRYSFKWTDHDSHEQIHKIAKAFWKFYDHDAHEYNINSEIFFQMNRSWMSCTHAVTRKINICVIHILIMMLIDQASLWFTLKSYWSWISYKIK